MTQWKDDLFSGRPAARSALHPPVSGATHDFERHDAEAGNLPQRFLMKRLRKPANVIIMFAASFALFAQGDDVPVKSQDHSSVPDVRRIVVSSMAATHRMHPTGYLPDDRRETTTSNPGGNGHHAN